jgi:hypothetical protein
MTSTQDIKSAYLAQSWNTPEEEAMAQQFDEWLQAHDNQVARKTMLDWIELQVEIVSKLGDPEDYNEVMAWDSAVRYYVNLTFPLPDHVHTRRSSFGDPYCETCGIDLEDTK